MCHERLESFPDDPELHQLAGVASMALNDLENARRHLEAALREDPENAHTLYFLSKYWHERGFPRKAEEAAERALSYHPHDALFWMQLAWISYSEHDFVRARERAEKAHALEPNDPAVANLLAAAEAECPDGTKWKPEEQVKIMKNLLATDPEDAGVHHHLGMIYFQDLGDYEQAARHLSTAVELDPSEPLSRKFLEKAVRRQDRVLRWLYWPWLLGPGVRRLVRWAGGQWWRWCSLLLLGVILFLPLILGFALWAVWIWPVAKGYEYLTIAEGRRAMKVVGGPGFLGVHYWSFGVRLTVFLLGLALFWVGLWRFWAVEAVRMGFGLLIGLVLVELSGHSLSQAWKTFCRGWRSSK